MRPIFIALIAVAGVMLMPTASQAQTVPCPELDDLWINPPMSFTVSGHCAYWDPSYSCMGGSITLVATDANLTQYTIYESFAVDALEEDGPNGVVFFQGCPYPADSGWYALVVTFYYYDTVQGIWLEETSPILGNKAYWFP